MKINRIFLLLLATQTTFSFSQSIIKADRIENIYSRYILVSTSQGHKKTASLYDTKDLCLVDNKSYDISISSRHYISDQAIIAKNLSNQQFELIRFKKDTLVTTALNSIKDFTPYSEGLLIATRYKDQKIEHLIIDSIGNEQVLSPDFDLPEVLTKFSGFSEGLACIPFKNRTPGKSITYGYIDAEGNLIIEPVFKNSSDFKEGLSKHSSMINNRLLWGFIDKTGKWAIPPTFSKEPSSYASGYSIITTNNGKKGFINKSGKIIIEAQYAHVSKFYSGKSIVSTGISTYKLIDTLNNAIKDLHEIRSIPFDFIDCASKQYHTEGGVVCRANSSSNYYYTLVKDGLKLANTSFSDLGLWKHGMRTARLYDKEIKESISGIIDAEGKWLYVLEPSEF